MYRHPPRPTRTDPLVPYTTRFRSLLFLVPVAAFVALALALAWGLTRDPRELPSALIGKPVPDFALPPVQGRTLGLSSTDLQGEVGLVNVFASWCTACRDEHPLFMRLRAEGVVPIHGLTYRARPEDAARRSEEHTSELQSLMPPSSSLICV